MVSIFGNVLIYVKSWYDWLFMKGLSYHKLVLNNYVFMQLCIGLLECLLLIDVLHDLNVIKGYGSFCKSCR